MASVHATQGVAATLQDYGVRVSPLQRKLLARVIDYVGDPGVAIDAILMERRPEWLFQMIGDVWRSGVGPV